MSDVSAPQEELQHAVTVDRHGKYAALGLTLLVHFLLVAFLLYGIRWQTKVSDAVEVELVGPTSFAAPAASASPVPPPPSPRLPEPVEPSPPAARPAPVPKAEPVPAPDPVRQADPRPDIALKEEKKKPEPRQQPAPPVMDSFQKQLEQELRSTAATRRAAEASNAAAKELADFQSAQAIQARSRAMADYIGRIRARIRGNIILPPDIKGNPEAVFEVVQFPSGEILSVHLKKSSGQPLYDTAVERAIHKSSPLPKPAQGELFSRTLELRFHPLDE